MAHESLQRPFEAYRGSEPYLFVSYAHKDNAVVYPEIERLYRLGWRIWYDEGIEAGPRWTDTVAKWLDRCSLSLVFISPKATVSVNVRNEIDFAIAHGKPILPIYLEETELPKGIELQIASFQAIFRFRETEETYLRRVDTALAPYEHLRGEPTETSHERSVPRPLAYASLVSIVLILVVGGILYVGFWRGESEPTKPTPSSSNELDRLRQGLATASRSGPEKLRVAIGEVTCGDSRARGTFGAYFSDFLRRHLADTSLTILAPGDVEKLLRASAGASSDIYAAGTVLAMGQLEAPTALVTGSYWPAGDTAVQVSLVAKSLATGEDLVPSTRVALLLSAIPPEYRPTFPCRMIPEGVIICTIGPGGDALEAALTNALAGESISVRSAPADLCPRFAESLLKDRVVPSDLVEKPEARALIACEMWVRIVDERYWMADAGGSVVLALVGEEGATIRRFPLIGAEIGVQPSRDAAIRVGAMEVIAQNRSTFKQIAEVARGAR